MPAPLLPKLKKDTKIVLTKRGEWCADAQTRLANLVEDIELTRDLQSDICSIPDFWARPELYSLVLADEEHDLHQRFLGEWRGILAMLGLREIRNLVGLKVTTVEIPEQRQENEAVLVKVLRDLLPDDYKKFKDKTAVAAYKLHIISWEEMPLAIIWPKILLFSAIDLCNKLSRPVEWWGVDGIVDPVKFLNDEEKAVLDDWLEVVKGEVADHASGDFANILIGRLGEFQKDLQAGESKSKNYYASTPLAITGFCECLGRANGVLVGKESFLESSNVLLINRRGSAAKNLLILSEDMDNLWNVEASKIVVGGQYSYATVYNKYTGTIEDPHKLGIIDLRDYNAELRLGEELFTDKICVVYNEAEIFPNALKNFKLDYDGSKANVILPLKSELLDYLPPQYLAEKTKIVVNGRDIEVELVLPLSGFDKNGKQLVVRKTYHSNIGDSAQNEIIYKGTLPLVQIWPNFSLPEDRKANWQAYYSYYNNHSQANFYATPFWRSHDVFKRELKENGAEEIIIGKSFPEAYACSVDVESQHGFEREDVGLILLRQPPVVNFANPTKAFKIGIDFGTTNTVAYMLEEGNGRPELVEFYNYAGKDAEVEAQGKIPLLYDVTLNDTAECEEAGRRKFIAMSNQPQKPTTSIRTIFHAYPGSYSSSLEKPLTRGNIYYPDGLKSVNKDKEIHPALQSDEMKWTNEGRENMKSFLLELAMQCLAEAVRRGATSNIKFSYSYPKAFSKALQRTLRGIWKDVLDALSDISKLVDSESEMDTESVAMANFFADAMQATINSGIVCFDIGGGSTDIAVWQGANNELRYQTSLRFAGKEILNKQLFAKKSVLLDLRNNLKELDANLELLEKEKNEKEFNLLVEALLKYKETEIFSSLNAKSALPRVEEFLRNIDFALAGIFFYAGMVVGYLRVTGNYDEYSMLPSCYIGGNGSKLLHWSANGKFDSRCFIKDLFQECMINGIIAGQDLENRQKEKRDIDERVYEDCGEDFDIICSTHCKQEVAYGLIGEGRIVNAGGGKPKGGMLGNRLGGNIIKASAEHTLDIVIAGEEALVGNEKRDALAEIKPEDILQGVQLGRELSVFKIFLEVFNREIKSLGMPTIDFPSGKINKIRAAVNQELVNKGKSADGRPLAKDEVEVEPLFIMILRQAMRKL